MIAFTRDELAILNAAAVVGVAARICRTAADLLDETEKNNMKQYDVYNYWKDVIGQVWAANADDALAVAQAEYGDYVYVRPAEREVETK